MFCMLKFTGTYIIKVKKFVGTCISANNGDIRIVVRGIWFIVRNYNNATSNNGAPANNNDKCTTFKFKIINYILIN